MSDLLQQLAPYFHANAGVGSVQAFDAIEAALGCALPAAYKGFLLRHDGGETLKPLGYYYFYPLAELLSRREDDHPADVLEFATDDGRGYAFDLSRGRSTASYPVVRYPLSETSREGMELVAADFADFLAGILRRLSRLPG